MISTDKFIVFNQPDIGNEEIDAVTEVMRSGWIGTGKVARQFEEEFADFMGGGYAVAVSSCTIGLQLALKTLNIDPLSEVITTPLTFAATLNAILSVDAKPILVDVDKTGCIDMDLASKCCNRLTEAIIPVHYSGTPCDLTKFTNHGIKIIEDCAHAFGSMMFKRGDFQVFSFYANKNITSGEGGMVLTKDKKMADKIRIMSAQGLSHGAWARYGDGPVKKYAVEEVGCKGNLPDILAAIGLAQLRRWPEMKAKRLKVFRIYEKAFGFMPTEHSTHFYPLRVRNRDSVRQKLYLKGIGTGVHYKPLHLEPAYQFLHYNIGDFPMAEAWGNEELSLPVSSNMSEDDAYRVVFEVKEAMK